MARPRAPSSLDLPKEPHLVSLKVLRLSKPSLAEQSPLPLEDPRSTASLAYPSDSSDHLFALTPALTLPPAFGSTHVGETFTCALCANNDLSLNDGSRIVTSIKISAEMQTPSQAVPLELYSPIKEDEEDATEPGTSIQRILRFDLKEEGNHVLAVNVSYTETAKTPSTSSVATGGRSRTFRKLYQFVAQPCLTVRTKATELVSQEIDDRSLGPYGKSKLLRFVLEAQLENVGETEITLQEATMDVPLPFESESLNWDLPVSEEAPERPILRPRDVLQIAYIVEQQKDMTEGLDVLKSDMKRDGRTTLGQLSIEWRAPMGERGYLTTGSLMTRRIAA